MINKIATNKELLRYLLYSSSGEDIRVGVIRHIDISWLLSKRYRLRLLKILGELK